MKYIILSIILLCLNYIYSAYSLSVSKDYAKKVQELKKEKERSLILKAELEKHINYKTAKDYAESAGFSPVDWGRVKLVKASK